MTSIAQAIEFRDTRLRTGVRLRYADVGPRDGRALLLLHGYSDSSFSFSRILELLPRDVRLIVPDQRGHGDSDRPADEYSPRVFAEDALALMNELGVRSAMVTGHSMGSFVAQQMAVVTPERVSALALVGSAASADNEVVRSLLPAVTALVDPVDVAFVREFQMSTLHRPVPEPFLERVIAESLKLPARVWRSVLAGLLSAPALTDPAAIRCPTAILWGDRDAIFSRSEQDDLLVKIPDARLHVFRDVGHDPQWEVPEEFARVLTGFLRA
jgi:non-heme chloroperoxidase